MNIINITNKFLTFEGSISEASDLVDELHEAYRTAGMDMNKTLHDFVFALEVLCDAEEAEQSPVINMTPEKQTNQIEP